MTTSQFTKGPLEHVQELVPNGVFPLPGDVPFSNFYESGFNFYGGITGTEISEKQKQIFQENRLDQNNSINLRWVTDVNLHPIHFSILQILNDPSFTVKSLKVDNIYASYWEVSVVFTLNNDIEKDIKVENDIILHHNNLKSDLIELVGSINMSPLYFSLFLRRSPSINDKSSIQSTSMHSNQQLYGYIDRNPEYIKGIIDIIISYVSSRHGVDVTNVVNNYFSNDHLDTGVIMTFIPYSNNHQIYGTSDELMKTVQDLDIEELYGKTLLSSDPIMIESLIKYSKWNPNEIDPSSITISNGLIMMSLQHSEGIELVKTLEEIDMLQNLTKKLRSNKIFVLPTDSRIALGNQDNYDLTKLKLFKEIALMWKGKVVRDGFPLIIKSTIEFDISFGAWYEQSLNLILSGKIPRYRIYNHLRWNLEYLETGQSSTQKIELMYAAVKCYTSLLDKYPSLIPYFSSPVIHADLSIEASFTNYSEVEDFIELLKGELTPMKKGTTYYSIIPMESLLDAITMRSYINDKYPETIPFIVRKNIDAGIKDTVVVKSFLNLKELRPNPDELDLIKQTIKNMFEKYYRMCDRPSLNEIETLPLDEILSLFPIYDPLQQTTVCLSSDTISERNLIFDPITKQPYQEKDMALYKNLLYGLLGYFTVNTLRGFRENPPIEHRNHLELGYPVISSIIITPRGKSYQEEYIVSDITFFDKDIDSSNSKHDFWSNVINPIQSPSNNINRNDDSEFDQVVDISSINSESGISRELFTLRLVPMNSSHYNAITSDPDISSIINFTPESLFESDMRAKNVEGGDKTNMYTDNIQHVTKLTENLWECGFFMSNWSKSYYYHRHKISSDEFHLPFTLVNGNNGIYDGFNALLFMKIVEMIFC